MSIRLQGSGGTSMSTFLQLDLTATHAVDVSTTPLSIAMAFKHIPNFVDYDPPLAVSSAANSRASSMEMAADGSPGSTSNLVLTDGGTSLSGGGLPGLLMSTGTWYYVAIVYQNAFDLFFYIGAMPLGTLTQYGPYSYGPPTTLMRYITMGQLAQQSLVTSLNGEIAIPRVWNVTKSQAALTTEGKSATPVDTANLVAGFALANTSDETDLSGHGLTWAANGGLGANYANGASSPPFPSGPPPGQFFLADTPLGALGWMINRRIIVPREEGPVVRTWRDSRIARYFLPGKK